MMANRIAGIFSLDISPSKMEGDVSTLTPSSKSEGFDSG